MTIVGRVPNIHPGQTRIVCRCRCGNYTVLAYGAFKRETTKSCGCYNIELHKKTMSEIGKMPSSKDYSKETNLFYDFIKPLDSYKNRSRIWQIRCKKCGTLYEEVPAMLVSETRRRGNNPCKCWQKISKGVKKIEYLLEDTGLPYEQEYKFSNCLSPKGNPMKFDFWVNNSYLIEYDGEQHFLETEWYGSNCSNPQERLVEQKLYDDIKNEWCKKHKISLIRIPYTHYQDLKIEDLIPETSKFLIKGENNG